jgi:hypothetical protein
VLRAVVVVITVLMKMLLEETRHKLESGARRA